MDRKPSRRQFLKVLAAGATSVASGLLAACGANSGPAGTTEGQTAGTTEGQTAAALEGAVATSAPAVSSGEARAVRALAWSNGPAIDDNFTRRVKAFNEAHQGQITVDLQFLPYDQYWQKIDLAYASNQPYDIYYWDVQAYGHYKRDLLQRIQPMIELDGQLTDKAHYPVHLYEPWKFDGANLYGVPENLQTSALFFNRDIFEKAGVKPPDDTWTWDDAVTAAKQLTVREGDNVTQWGMDIGDLGVWWGLQTLSWSQGDAFFDKVIEPTKFNMQSPANLQTLRFVQDLIWKEKVAPSGAQREAMGQDVGIFESGKTAMRMSGSWSIAGFSSLPFKWDMAPLPKWKDKRVVPYWLGGWVIPKASKVSDAAFEFAHWSATSFQSQMAKDHDWIPLKNEARESQEMLAAMPPGFKTALAAVADAQIGDLYHRNSAQILNEVLGPTLTQLYDNKLTPEDAAKEIDEKANELLNKA